MNNKITEICNGNLLTVFPAPDGAVLNNADFKVEMNVGTGWVKLPVYYIKTAYYNGVSGYNVHKASMATADISGKAEIKVTSLSRNIEHCKIRPLSDNVKFVADRTTVCFTVDKPLQLSVEINGDIHTNLHLFLNAPETDIPDKNDENVIYIPTGIHDINNCEYIHLSRNGIPTVSLCDGKTLYLEGGAMLKASVHIKGDNVKICGRGMIDLIDFNSKDCRAYSLYDRNKYPQGIKIDHADNVEIHDIIVKNPCHYIINGSQCTNVTIDNAKLFACHSWSDGIDMMSSAHITIKNTFVRSNDDSIAIYARRWDNIGNTYDWHVENCILWADSAHPINIGSHGTQTEKHREELYDIHFKDIDILEVHGSSPMYFGCISFLVGDDNICHDFTFEDFRIDDFTSTSLISVKSMLNGDFNPTAGAEVRDITFKDIVYNGINRFESPIFGCDNDRMIKNVKFQNLVINGKKCETFEEANIKVGAFCENITIE